MMFSTRAEYGVRVMVELARRGADDERGCVSLAEIADGDGLPLAYLEHLAARLRKAGLVESRRGARGGYLLARPADEISMAEVVEALEGSIAPIECISEGADGLVVCTRETETDHVVPHQAAVDARARLRSCARSRRPVSPTSSRKDPRPPPRSARTPRAPATDSIRRPWPT